MVRLLQKYDAFYIAQAESAPAASLPPVEWKTAKGRMATEDIHPQSAITLYAKVSVMLASCPAVEADHRSS